MRPMIRRSRLLLVALLCIVAGLAIIVQAVDGPITNALNLRVRTDGNNYLLASTGTYSGVDGPITAFGNLRLRTDQNNYLMVALTGTQAFGAITATTGVFSSDVTARDLIAGAARNIYFTGRSLFTSTADKLLQVLDNAAMTGTEISNGTPTLGTCTGGAMTSGSHNTAGQVTGNTSGTCAVTFGTPNFTNTPFCQATDGTGARALFITAASASTFTVNGLTSGDAFTWVCLGRIGT